MKPIIVKGKSLRELETSERCYIAENWIAKGLSIARARVKPGVTTRKHHLKEVDEIYLVTKGKGKVEVGGAEPVEVAVGDIVFIPAGSPQRIMNIGKTDLTFYCVCTPEFTQDCYCDEDRP